MKIVKVDLMIGDTPIEVTVQDKDFDAFVEFINDATDALEDIQ